jgi:hypothetical protein
MSKSDPADLVTVHRGRCHVSAAPTVGGNARHARHHRAAGAVSLPPVATAPQPVRDTQCQWIRQALIAAYHSDTYRLLRDLADALGATVAYIDRATVEAHLERDLSDTEWAAVNDQFTAMDFDDHIGEQGRLRTDWIETLLTRAGVPGHGYSADGQPRRDQGHEPI